MGNGNAMNLAGMKILLVDDLPENINTLAIAPESEGFILEMASSGEETLQIVESFLPDLILLDIRMGGMDGIETCRQLKKRDVTNDIPVIFLTVSKETKDIDQGFLCGGVDHISKPFRQEEVCARV